MKNRLLLSYAAVVLAMLVALGVPLGFTFARAERRELENRVKHDALALALRSVRELRDRDHAALRITAADYTRRTGARVVITDDAGVSVADSEDARRPLGRDFSTRPEVAAALRGSEAVGTRRSDTLGTTLLYVAEPVATGGEIHGTVRVTYPTSFVQARIRRVWGLLAAIGAVILGFSMLLASVLAAALSAPLRALSATASRLGAGDLTARAETATSLPEVRVLADVINETAGKLDALVSGQREFLSHASHQLRSPLAALRLRLENLEDDLSGTQAASVTAALREVQRLSRLVDGLLSLARLDETSADPGPVCLTDVMDERIAVWDPYAAEREVALARDGDAAVWARATAGQLEQVLDNLLSNALDVAPAGSTVTLAARQAGRYAELHVIDEGPGMPAADRAAAFDRFWRSADSAGSPSRSGLGLAIVRRLVTADSGDVSLEPASTGGIDAVVRLPLDAAVR